jgi:DHA1 family inner membrane transport protein
VIGTGAGPRGVATLLFAALFAAQAAVIALAPVLSRVAADLGVSTAVAGQLRTLLGLAAGGAALALPLLSRYASLRRLMLGGTLALAGGSLASAAAPGLVTLAAAQVAIGLGVGAVVSAATAAAAGWTAPEHRTHVLAWALAGQPAAWIVGMPLVGALGEVSWRLAWLALPFAAALLAALLLARRPEEAATEAAGPPGQLLEALRDRRVARWAAAELLASCGWTGTLVYAGALFVESYGTSATVTGVLLAFGAAAYLGGNLAAKRVVGAGGRRELAALSLLLAIAIPLFGAVRTGALASTALFAAAAFVAGGRTLLGSVVGLAACPDRRLAVMGVRTATTQLGYFAGSAAAGGALALGGYPALGVTLGAFFAAAAWVLRPSARSRTAVREAAYDAV